jgi:hypothetical protein
VRITKKVSLNLKQRFKITCRLLWQEH